MLIPILPAPLIHRLLVLLRVSHRSLVQSCLLIHTICFCVLEVFHTGVLLPDMHIKDCSIVPIPTPLQSFSRDAARSKLQLEA